MNIKLKEVLVDEKEILRHLLEKYDYEFSQYDNRDVNKLGLYGYEYLDNYWTEENRWPYFIIVDNNLAGLVMVRKLSENKKEVNYGIAEFFVMYKYRRKGIGRVIVKEVFDMFRGNWQVSLHPKNIASVHFWKSVIEEYTSGNYKFKSADSENEYDDGSYADVYYFSN